MIYDVIIIGKGPAGISASLYTARANLKTLIIGKNESALSNAKEIENYYGFEQPVSGQELLDNGISQAQNLGIEIITDEVVGISYQDNLIVKTVNGEHKAKAIVLATGTKRSKPKIKGVKEYEGKGISYCAVCDGFFHKNKNVAVIGSGDYAVLEALELTPIVNSVTILTNGKEAREVRNPKITFNNKIVTEVRGDDTQVQTIEFEDDSSLDISGVFIAEGTAAALDLAKKIGIETEGNNIVVDTHMRTSVPGVFACGDCTGGVFQISKAVYEGTQAGLAVIEFLKS
ncbi:MAG: FAD-dependent oxidoreductase [Oscillospiraceae bacterium]|nr:FAD-dependent oxidoreductase [Oscillospiraceae bacterium]